MILNDDMKTYSATGTTYVACMTRILFCVISIIWKRTSGFLEFAANVGVAVVELISLEMIGGSIQAAGGEAF